MTHAEFSKLEQLHNDAVDLLATLLALSTRVVKGSEKELRLKRLAEKAGIRAERRCHACMKAWKELEKKEPIPVDIRSGYITTHGVVRHCFTGPGQELPRDFQEWVDKARNQIQSSTIQ